MEKMEWNKVTKISQVVAIILFVGVYFFGFYFGKYYENRKIFGKPISENIKFYCDDGKIINTTFYHFFVKVEENDLGVVYLPQTISASGARYGNAGESLVVWNKAGGLLVLENGVEVNYRNCNIKK